MKRSLLLLFAAALCLSAGAQQVGTLFFLENAPMRHTINPALQPVSQGYLNFSPVGWMSLRAGNNSLTLSDVVYTVTGPDGMPRTITALHPEGDKAALLRALHRNTIVGASADLNLLSLGFRSANHPGGYYHFGVRERIDGGVSIPRSLPEFLLGGMMTDPAGTNTLSMTGLNLAVQAYTEISGGYSAPIGDRWRVGGKLKFLVGQAYAGLSSDRIALDASADELALHAHGRLYIAAPIRMDLLPRELTPEAFKGFDFSTLLPSDIGDYAVPSGYGAAFDLGFTCRPAPWVQLSAAVVDLGFLYWNGNRYTCRADTVCDGVGEIVYGDYTDADGTFHTDSLGHDLLRRLEGFAGCMSAGYDRRGFARMISGRFNAAVDFNLWNNRIGLGLLSATRFSCGHVYEELTLGAALRPCNWFNLAFSYSLLDNGRYSNLGAGLSFMPYDGVNFTLAMDYIPTSYAALDTGEKRIYCIPDRLSNLNLAFGFSVVWGSNPKKGGPHPGPPLGGREW